MSNISPVKDLDFFATKEALKAHLKNQVQFKDYDFEGSNMSVLLDVLSYNTFYNNFYYNMAISEMFLDSAQQRNSIISHAKELNYLPRSRRSSVAIVTITIFKTFGNVIDAAGATNFPKIPKDTSLTGKCGDTSFTFLTDKDLTAYGAYSTGTLTRKYTLENVSVYQGRMITETLTTTDTTLSNSWIDTTSLTLTVNDEEYLYKTDIFGVKSTDKVFYLQPEEDGKYSVQFGQDRFGANPPTTANILATYRICNGPDADGVVAFAVKSIENATATITSTSNGGAYEESTESIRSFAPKAVQVQDRAVTKNDYEILLTTRFPNIQAISVYGGDEVVPPQYGKVIISVDVTGGDGAADFDIASFKEYLKDKTPLTIEPVFVDAKFLYVDAVVNVVFDSNTTSVSHAAIQSKVTDAIIAYQTKFLNGFNLTLHQSRLAAVLDAVDTSIVSTGIFTQPIIEFVPVVTYVQNPSFSFEAALVQPYVFDEDIGFVDYKPAVKTSRFTFEGALVTLQDDGNGRIMAVTAGSGAESVFKRNIGVLDYDTGYLRLSNFIVDSYEGASIKFTANTVKKDVKAPKDRIISIRPQDIVVNVTSLTE